MNLTFSQWKVMRFSRGPVAKDMCQPPLHSASLADVPDRSQMSGKRALDWPKSGRGPVATD